MRLQEAIDTLSDTFDEEIINSIPTILDKYLNDQSLKLNRHIKLFRSMYSIEDGEDEVIWGDYLKGPYKKNSDVMVEVCFTYMFAFYYDQYLIMIHDYFLFLFYLLLFSLFYFYSSLFEIWPQAHAWNNIVYFHFQF